MSDDRPLSDEFRAMASELRAQAEEARMAEDLAALESEVNDSGPNILGLSLEAIFERLDRIENLLGITDPTPAEQELDFYLSTDD